MNAPIPSSLHQVHQNTGPALLLLVDEFGNPIAFNRSARQFLLPKEEIAWVDIVHSEDLGSWESRLKVSLAGQTQITGWFRLRRFDHAIRQFVLRAEPRYDVEGTFAGYLVSGLDVTDIGHEITQNSVTPPSSTKFDPADSLDDSVVVHKLAKQWHDALVKDATVLGGATQLLRDYLPAADGDDLATGKALKQLEEAAGAICTLVSKLNSLSRQA